MKRRQYRGRGGRVHADAHAGPSEPVQVQPPPQAYIRAYEAQLVDKTGPALIPWAGDESVLADRHNILHLLPDIPSPLSSLGSSSGSISSSWTVSSDAEEEFDLSGDEVAAYARTRRQKWVDGLRATRLAERERQDADEAERVLQAEEAERDESRRAASGIHGGVVMTQAASKRSRKPPPDVAQLMAHTARSLAASPNATILVSKIMARHASDARFAFLRPEGQGKWPRAWARAKAAAGIRPPTAITAARSSQSGGGLGGLGGYDSQRESESESESESDNVRHPPSPPPPPPEDIPPPPPPGPPPPSPPM